MDTQHRQDNLLTTLLRAKRYPPSQGYVEAEFLGNVEFDNGLVYELYGLTEKEIGIVEAGK